MFSRYRTRKGVVLPRGPRARCDVWWDKGSSVDKVLLFDCKRASAVCVARRGLTHPPHLVAKRELCD